MSRVPPDRTSKCGAQSTLCSASCWSSRMAMAFECAGQGRTTDESSRANPGWRHADTRSQAVGRNRHRIVALARRSGVFLRRQQTSTSMSTRPYMNHKISWQNQTLKIKIRVLSWASNDCSDLHRDPNYWFISTRWMAFDRLSFIVEQRNPAVSEHVCVYYIESRCREMYSACALYLAHRSAPVSRLFWSRQRKADPA